MSDLEYFFAYIHRYSTKFFITARITAFNSYVVHNRKSFVYGHKSNYFRVLIELKTGDLLNICPKI
jgi:hypothetical protein